MRILFVSAYVPSRIRVRPYSFIKALAQRGHAVTLVCGCGDDDSPALEELRAVCQQVVAVPVSTSRMFRNALRALPGELPLQAALSYGEPLLSALRNTMAAAERAGQPFDVAHIEHLRASALVSQLRQIPVVLDSVDCISLLFERALRGSPSWKSRLMALVDLARTRRYEARYPQTYDEVIVTSPEDAWALKVLAQHLLDDEREADGAPVESQAAPRPITVVPNGVDLAYFAPQPIAREAATVIFSGKMSYHANVAAALFLAQEIMPLVWQQRPEVKLVLAGSAPPAALQALAADSRISVTGYVDDLRTEIARATLAVAPLRYGVGIQNKVLEAMALETPTIAARQAARALAIEEGRELLLASDADEYAAAILHLLQDAAARKALGAAARCYVQQHHDWDRIVERLETVYQHAIGPASSAPAPVTHALAAD